MSSTSTHAVARAFEGLPSSNRHAFLLAREGRSYAEVAAHMDAPVAKVRTWVLHAVLAMTQARLAAARVPVNPAG